MPLRTCLFVVLVLLALPGAARAQTPPAGLQGAAFRTWLRENFYDGKHKTLSYVEARRVMYNVIDNNDNKIVDVYGGLERALPKNGTESNPAPLNAEHTVPQSFFEERLPMRTDLHHLFPAYARWNSTRQNHPFREIPDETAAKWMFLDDERTDRPPANERARYSEYANRSFEPREDHKGNVARAVFYFYTMYPEFDIGRVGDMDMFYAWHLADPVDAQERERNRRVQQKQGDLNPFVDHADWVSRAWIDIRVDVATAILKSMGGGSVALAGSTAGRDVINLGEGAAAADTMIAHFIDVGQGHATLLEFSCGAVLVDTGGELSDKVDSTAKLLNYLDAFFARRSDLNRTIDLLAITHAHVDHTRGIPALLDGNYRIRGAIDNGLRNGSGASQQRRLQDSAKTEGYAYRAVREAEITSTAGLTNGTIDPVNCQGTNPVIRALWGALEEGDGWDPSTFENGNNHSVVLRVDFGQSAFLFTGDLQEDAIDDLVAFYEGSNTLDVDVYQVGHHASHNGTNEELMRALSARIAVIPMGDPRASHDAFTAYAHGHPRFNAVDHLTAADHGVSAFRSKPVDVPIGLKGVCSNCNPPKPSVFENRSVERAVFGTGWDGTVRITARANGEMNVRTDR